MTVEIYDKWSKVADARVSTQRSADTSVHGLSGSDIEAMRDRFEKFTPGLASKYASNDRLKELFSQDLPKGASWSSTKTAQYQYGTPGGGKTLTTNQMPYQPEFSSPDRQQYPVHRILANRYWRMFYKLDPVIGNCIEMYGDLPWSNFELTGDGIEGEIRAAYEQQCRETQVLALLPYLVKEFMVVGEAVPHCTFDDTRGIFTHIALHNPDQLEVIDAPFIKMDPILEFIPDDRLRSILTSDQAQLQAIKDRMPPELLSKLYSKQNIPLSPINTTFIPRRLHPYDTRGTSILSRMWRILMYEDAVFNASIQTARRHAAPIKVAKLGNAATGWIPPPEQEKRLLEMLAQAEQDPNAWLVYHYGIQFDTVGTTDRSLAIGREWDVIERIKLVALGVNKSFLHGEVSYASSATGLQVFLQRLKSLRMFFEQKWLYPKFFKPVAEINGWIKPKPAEVMHRFRVKRSQRELEESNAYILPKIVWDKSLDPQINMELVNAVQALEGIGVRFSKTSKMAAIGFSFEEETKKIHREMEFEKQYLPKIQPPAGGEGGAGGMGGLGGGGAPPPGATSTPSPEESGASSGPPGSADAPPGIATPPTPGGAAVEVKADGDHKEKKDVLKPSKSTIDRLKSEVWVDDTYGNWQADEIADVVDLFETGDSDSAFWAKLGKSSDFKRAHRIGNRPMMWNSMVAYLENQSYPDSDIQELKYVLTKEGLITQGEPGQIDLIEELPDNTDQLSDVEFADAVANILKKESSNKSVDSSFLTGI